MSVTLSLAITSVGPKLGNVVMNGVATVYNGEADTITIERMQIFEQSTMGAAMSGPYFLTPNEPPGEGQPELLPAATRYYPFQVVCAVPNTPGASPNAPNAMHGSAFPATNSVLRIAGTVSALDTDDDPHVGEASLIIPLASAVAPSPVPQGGALQFNTAGDGIHWFFL